MRARYIHGATGKDLNRTPVPEYLRKKYTDDYPYFDETNEVFVVRDLIAHNHLVKLHLLRIFKMNILYQKQYMILKISDN